MPPWTAAHGHGKLVAGIGDHWECRDSGLHEHPGCEHDSDARGRVDEDQLLQEHHEEGAIFYVSQRKSARHTAPTGKDGRLPPCIRTR